MNIKEIKRDLLQETNYRCGYCMKNITPKMYYIEEEPTNPKPVFDYTYRKIYNVHDRAHIEPNSEARDDFQDIYNLIVLCKQCHWEIDKPGMLNITELKRQKLYWIISSGRFTRLEINIASDLYFANKAFYENTGHQYISTELTIDAEKKKIFGNLATLNIPYRKNAYTIENNNGIADNFFNDNLYFYEYRLYNPKVFCRNMIKEEFLACTIDTEVSINGQKFPHGIYSPGRILLTDSGYKFCQKFQEVLSCNP